jgi:choline dehydrogenase-like flavoprotein
VEGAATESADLPPESMAVLARLADPSSGLWEACGYQPFPLGLTARRHPVRPDTIALAEARGHYDVVVVGSGAGGGVAARVLAEAGASVLVVERGRWTDRDAPGMDHLRNHRGPLLGDGTSPDGHPRARLGRNGHEVPVGPLDDGYHNNAITIGGGSRLFGAQAWRFHPDDFRMASVYGVPEGSALADWPISYDDLAPFYRQVEWDVGVAATPDATTPGGDFPMPPWPPGREGRLLLDAAGRLGWTTTRVPLLINTEARDGRAACVRCGFCVGFPCPVDAKNGSDVAAVPKAVRLGAQLLAGAQVVRISDDGAVEVVADTGHRTIRAGRILLAAGAIETARLLQVSRIGNDWVGDCLQGHTYVGAYGRFDDVVVDGLGPGPSVATRQFTHHNEGVVGGGLLANDFVKLPTLFYLRALPPDAPRHGQAAIDEVTRWYRRTGHVYGPVQELPTRAARVRLSDRTADAAGVPVARLEGSQHPEDLRTAELLAAKAQAWLQEAGAQTTWRVQPRDPVLSGGQHQAGTARMAETPKAGATDPHGRVWGTERVYVADASLHVTNGGANPSLTIMALAWRTAAHIAALAP